MRQLVNVWLANERVFIRQQSIRSALCWPKSTKANLWADRQGEKQLTSYNVKWLIHLH